jgi:GNAT superfamily N-acetyltransferase
VEFIPTRFEDWAVWMQPPAVQLDRVWVAFSGEAPVGYSFLEFHPSLVHTGYTGVLATHRGQGIARALTLATLRQALELGVKAVETGNDFENAPILHLNEDLGYRSIPGQLEFHKTVHRD